MCDCPASVRNDDLDTLDGQIAALAPFIDQASREVAAGIACPDRRGLIGGAVIAINDGHREHGRGLFDMSDLQLHKELEREFEDAVVYRAEQLRRESLK